MAQETFRQRRHFSTRHRLAGPQNKKEMNTFAQQDDDAPPLLLIDDDLSLGRLIREYCETDGFVVTAAATGEEGIYLAQQRLFQLVILDVMLPGINGFEVLKRIRQRSNVPVLMLTTRGAARRGIAFRVCKREPMTTFRSPSSRRN